MYVSDALFFTGSLTGHATGLFRLAAWNAGQRAILRWASLISHRSICTPAGNTSYYQPHRAQHDSFGLRPYVPFYGSLIIFHNSSTPVGASMTAPFYGRITDTRGPRILLTVAFLLLLLGYLGTLSLYDAGPHAGATTASPLTISLLLICAFMIGSGSSSGITAAVNTTAKTFPDNAVCIPTFSIAS